jgi:3alpha(or 20beta)-hydroxysteroid dehydrogenase
MSIRSQGLEGKKCFITDGARGIDGVAAELFAQHGVNVAIADVKDELGENVADGIKTGGGKRIYSHCDVIWVEDGSCVRIRSVTFGR